MNMPRIEEPQPYRPEGLGPSVLAWIGVALIPVLPLVWHLLSR